MSDHHLAQLNIAQMKFAIDDPGMADFVGLLDEINALADAAAGFVWRLQTEDGDATAIDFFGADMLVNMSVWTDIDSLHDYVYRSAHSRVMAQRREWFEHLREAYSVLWWIPVGHLPTLDEAKARLESLRENGPGEQAFTFKQRYLPG